MIKVGLITGWTDRCGITEYGKHLVKYVNDPSRSFYQDVRIEVLPIPFSAVMGVKDIGSFDIIQMNESGYVMQGFDQNVVFTLQRYSIKTLLTCHTANLKNNKNSLTQLFDRVVVHEKDTVDGFDYLPQGALVYPDRYKQNWTDTIGMCGFPLPWKNHLKVAAATANLGLGFLALIPESNHANAIQMGVEIKRINPMSVVMTEWLTDEAILRLLSTCLATCFPYKNNTPGPSAAAMNGVSCGRPVIVSRCSQFSHLFGRDDEFTFIESEDPTVEDITRAISKVQFLATTPDGTKIPTKTYEEMRWDKVAEGYVRLYKDMLANA